MRAFLSHSSANKDVVVAVHDAFEPNLTWIDRAEIEWGALFLEKIADGITEATDFVLFWSLEASKSEWVRLEVNMAFIQALRRKAIRLRVIALDSTPLPLYLQPFHTFSVADSTNQVGDIVAKLGPVLAEPSRTVRSSFINRNDEIGRIESAIDDSSFRCILAFGFTGVGKSSLIKEALARTFAGTNPVIIDVQQGTGPVELALLLASLVRGEELPTGLDPHQILKSIRLSFELLAKTERFLILTNIQHWLSEDGRPSELLCHLLELIASIEAFARRPVFLTSTRRPVLYPEVLRQLYQFQVSGLSNQQVAILVRNWFFTIYGKELSDLDAKRVAPKLFGHPVAARLVAGLLGSFSAEFLDQYPSELVGLRRDLARTLLQGLQLDPPSVRLMETLALSGSGLPATVLVASGLTEAEFQVAVSQCASAGLITADKVVDSHPLFQDFFWHRLHRGDYRKVAADLADALAEHLTKIDRRSPEFVSLIPVTFRAFALAGRYDRAAALRSDLHGELESAAITLYNRRDYALADQYVSQVLDYDPLNWRMRLYRARIRIQQESFLDADRILQEMLVERPGDVGVLHSIGRLQLRQGKFSEALNIFTRVVAKREHVASLTGAAEALYRMHRHDEAVAFLARAKEQESENFYVLDLESRIMEDQGKFDLAYEAALLASARDPMHAHLHVRLGVISSKRNNPELAVGHFLRALEIDPHLFNAAHSLASAYLDMGDVANAESTLARLSSLERNPSNHALVEHIRARVSFAKGELDACAALLNRELAGSRNTIPNLGLLIEVECKRFDRENRELPAIAETHLQAAENALANLLAKDPVNEHAARLQAKIEERKPRPNGG